MRSVSCAFAAVLSLAGVMTLSDVRDASGPIKATLCDLAQHPETFMGKMVQVRASVAGKDLWIDDFDQKPACPSWMGVIVILPEQANPKPDFDVVQDDAFKQFFRDLKSGMTVQATFEGRFEATYTWRDRKKIWLVTDEKERKGFGKKEQYGGEIVLRRVSDVLAKYLPRK